MTAESQRDFSFTLFYNAREFYGGLSAIYDKVFLRLIRKVLRKHIYLRILDHLLLDTFNDTFYYR